MGTGWGGARVGAGRPRKSASEHVLAGTRSRAFDVRAEMAVSPVAAVVLSDDFSVPDDLSPDERLVWLRLAPHAVQARTLTPGTVYGFILLCRNIVLERELAKDKQQRGGG